MTPHLTYLVHRVLYYGDFHYFIISLLFLLISSFLRHFSIGPQAFLGSYSTSLGLPYLTYLVYRALCYGNFHPFSPLLTNQLISQALGLSNDASL